MEEQRRQLSEERKQERAIATAAVAPEPQPQEQQSDAARDPSNFITERLHNAAVASSHANNFAAVRSRHAAFATTLATITLLVSVSAFALTAGHGDELRASLTRNISSTRDAATSFVQTRFASARGQLPDAIGSLLKNNLALAQETITHSIASFGNISSQTSTQLAAAATPSDNFLQWLGNSIYRALCPLFTDCAQEIESAPIAPSPQPPQFTQSDDATKSLNVKSPPSLPASPDATATTVAISNASQKSRATPPPTIVQQPIIERVRETVHTVIEPGVNASYVDDRISLLENSLLQKISGVSSSATNSITQVFNTSSALARIEHLDELDLTNPTITGGTITGATISGANLTAPTTSRASSRPQRAAPEHRARRRTAKFCSAMLRARTTSLQRHRWGS